MIYGFVNLDILFIELPDHAPVLVEELDDVNGYEGSRIEMSCTIMGKPEPTLVWWVI